MRDFEVDLHHPWNELCNACGERRGGHFDKFCVARTSRTLGEIELDRGQSFEPSGVFTMRKGQCWDLLYSKDDPNTAFKLRKGV